MSWFCSWWFVLLSFLLLIFGFGVFIIHPFGLSLFPYTKRFLKYPSLINISSFNFNYDYSSPYGMERNFLSMLSSICFCWLYTCFLSFRAMPWFLILLIVIKVLTSILSFLLLYSFIITLTALFNYLLVFILHLSSIFFTSVLMPTIFNYSWFSFYHHCFMINRIFIIWIQIHLVFMQPFSVLKISVLVTGHTGFKGSWLCLWLHQLGAHLYGISSSYTTFTLKQRIYLLLEIT